MINSNLPCHVPSPCPVRVIRLRHRGAKRKQVELVKYATKCKKLDTFFRKCDQTTPSGNRDLSLTIMTAQTSMVHLVNVSSKFRRQRQPGAFVTHTPFHNGSSDETSDENPDDEGQPSLVQTPNADSSSNEMSEEEINRTRLLLRHPTRRQTNLLRHLPKYTYTKEEVH